MRLTRVFVEARLETGSIVELPVDAGAHLVKVLRARSGDELVLFNGDGRDFSGVVGSVRGKHVCAEIGAAHLAETESRLAVTLVQCLPRAEKMDLVVQKATELGVTRIVPVISQRSVVRLDDSPPVLIVEVIDDGVGFDPDRVEMRSRHLGLTSMEERARELGGRIEIRSAPGAGTTVRLELRTR